MTVSKSWSGWIVVGLVVVSGSLAGVVAGGEEKLERLSLPGRTDDRPFSHAVVAGDTVYVAGTLGINPETGAPPVDPMDEARLALDGMKAKLALAGATMDDLVRVEIFCPDLSLYADFNAVYRTYFEEGYPTRAFIGSGPLLRGARFEVTGIAVTSNKK